MDQSDKFTMDGISLSIALDFVSDGVLIIDQNFEVHFFNKAAREICGLLPEGNYRQWPSNVGVFQKDRVSLYDPERLPIVRALRGESVADEHLFLFNDLIGKWKCVSCNTAPIKVRGEIVGAILSFRDITEILAKEAQSLVERESYHKILNSLPAFVYTKDLAGNLTFSNDFFKGFLQSPSGSRSTPAIFMEPSQSSAQDLEVISSKRNVDREDVIPNALGNGTDLVLRTTRIPLVDQEGLVYGICGISFDVTEERERKKALEEERSKIATASKLAALGVLAAELGHEINNPLAIIRTGSWILRKIITSEDFQRTLALTKLDEIDNTIHRISDIVTSVKNLSRDSSQEKMQDHLLSDILRDVQSLCAPKFHPKGIELRLNTRNPILQRRIRCYRVQLSEVFINLLVNAADAVQAPSQWIQLDIAEEGENLIFRVRDSGPGVPEEIERKIFTPFFSTKDIGKGTGLGLSISKEIMKRHGGDLVLNRNISNNCFEATLPKRGKP